MKKWTAVLLVLALAGCGEEPKTTPQSANAPAAQNSGTTPAQEQANADQKLHDDRAAAAKAKYDAAPNEVKACSDVLAKVGEGTLKTWGAKVKATCGKLPKEQQILAADGAAGLNPDIWYAPKTDVAEILDAIKDGGSQPFRFDQANAAGEWLAMNGNYQAQRNYAYLLQEKGDWLSACVWRGVIIDSGHKDAGEGDVSNLKVACGKLDQAQIALAQSKEKTLMTEILKLK